MVSNVENSVALAEPQASVIPVTCAPNARLLTVILISPVCPSQADTVVGNPRVDEEVMSEVIRLGFERALVMDGIRSRAQNKATVTYYLLCDNR